MPEGALGPASLGAADVTTAETTALAQYAGQGVTLVFIAIWTDTNQWYVTVGPLTIRKIVG